MSPQTLSSDEYLTRFKSQIPLFEGAEAVFIESPTVAHVRVSQVKAREHVVEALVTDLHGLGMGRLKNNPCAIGNIWTGFAFSKDHWCAGPYVSWYLSFDVEMIELLKEVATACERHSLTMSTRVARSILATRLEARIQPLLRKV